jgi:mRNA interferase RelE/StbE
LIWTIEWDDRARRELRRLDPAVQREILGFLRLRIAVDGDPRRFGKSLRVVVLVLKVGHRRNVYD